MSDHDDVSACVLTLDRTIGELANQYGAGSVAAALTEVVRVRAQRAEHCHRQSARTLLTREGYGVVNVGLP